MNAHENPPDKYEDLLCNCGSTLRSNPGAGWSCDQCGAHCTATGRIAISEPATFNEHFRPNLKPLSQGDKAFLQDFDWGALEDSYLGAYSEADVRLSFRNLYRYDPEPLPGDDERRDEVS